MKKRFSARRITLLALFVALGLVMFVVESLFPPLFVPGAKMGLSNIFSLAALVALGPIEAIIVVVARVTLGCFIMGFSAFPYSISAGLVSILVEILIFQLLFPRVSLIAISILAAAVHNITQNLVFALASGSAIVLSYAPYLIAIGVLSGLIVGLTVLITVKKIPMREFVRLLAANTKTGEEVESN